jgi:predicted transcriptional regulator of viral defense system
MNNTVWISDIEKLLAKGPMRSKELEEFGFSRMEIKRLVEEGLINRIGKGLYGLYSQEFDEHQQLLEVCKQNPNAVVCLLSALNVYDLTSELPHEIWIAVPRGARTPTINYPPKRVFHMSKSAYNAGIDELPVSGGKIKIYSPAKTVADCFKYRNKIGKDVAIRALNECWQQRLATVNDIMKYAEICRVKNVMRPYLEAVIDG